MRIIYRYISKQLFVTTLVVSSILVLVLVGGRFIKYLEHAAEGRLLGEVIFIILLFRLPEFLEMILPLGMFLGILLAFGRMYLEHEMSVLSACGVSQLQLTRVMLAPVIGMTTAVATLSLVIGPIGIAKSERIMIEQRSQSEFETLTPGRFHVTKTQDKVTYAGQLSKNRERMENIFIAEMKDDKLVAVVAESGVRRVDRVSGAQYLELRKGYRYEAKPGEQAARVTEYAAYQLKLADPDISPEISEIRATPTLDLLAKETTFASAELQWRIALPMLVPIVVLLAIPLSKVNPRQGRFLKIIPAILLYMSYLSLLINCKGKIEKGTLDPSIGLWWVHLLFLSIAMGLYLMPWLSWRWQMHRSSD